MYDVISDSLNIGSDMVTNKILQQQRNINNICSGDNDNNSDNNIDTVNSKNSDNNTDSNNNNNCENITLE